jgi:hypothetical protein
MFTEDELQMNSHFITVNNKLKKHLCIDYPRWILALIVATQSLILEVPEDLLTVCGQLNFSA